MRASYWNIIIYSIASVVAVLFHNVLYIVIPSLAGALVLSFINARRTINTIAEAKVMPFSPMDQFEMQRLIDAGLYKDAVMLALGRAYGITEKDLNKLTPKDINIMLLKLSKEIEFERRKNAPVV